jgi:type VI secretion system protein VasD
VSVNEAARRTAVLLLLGCFLAVGAGCGSSTPPLLRGALAAGPGSNPDLRGRPSPVVVRVYELRSVGAFSSADFFSLFEKEQEALGGDLIGREEFTLQPGEKRPYQRQLQPDTRFIGVVAAFRDLENSRWRQTAPVPSARRPTLTIGVEALAVTVMVQ